MKRAPVKLLSASLLLLALCASPTLSPALVPEPPGGGGGGGGGSGNPHWQITVTRSGQTTISVRNPGGQEVYPSGTYPWGNPNPPEPSLIWMDVGYTVTINSAGTHTVSAVRVDAQGNPATPPDDKKKLHLLLTAHAGWSLNVDDSLQCSISHSADDGWADPEDVEYSFYNGVNGASDGKHLITLDGSSGTATYTCQQQHANISVQSTGASGTVSASCSLTALEDTRAVTISSAVDPTYYRVLSGGVPTQVANVRAADGTMYGDTVIPFPYGVSIAYSAATVGAWANNSEYHWYSSLTGYWDQGTFQPAAIPDLNPVYSGNLTAGSVDHIFIHLIDSADSANATANYYMTFHDKYENWATPTMINHPIPFGPWPDNPPSNDWTLLYSADNRTSVTQTPSVTLSWSITKTESGTIGGQLVTQATDPAGFVALQTNASITSTTEVSCSISQTIPVTVPPYSVVDVYVAPTWVELAGTCSLWGASGYVGDIAWSGVRVPNSGGAQVLSIGYWQEP
jgi:hypothetical protein